MTERAQAITLHGNPLTLEGNPVSMGNPAPEVTLLDNDLKPVVARIEGALCLPEYEQAPNRGFAHKSGLAAVAGRIGHAVPIIFVEPALTIPGIDVQLQGLGRPLAGVL